MTYSAKDHILINNNLPLFDSEFALKQFSGNRPLLSKVLDTFCQQYATFSAKLVADIEQNEFNTVKRDVHTVKGVSGNLGMKSLYQASNDLKINSQQSTAQESDIAGYMTILNDTLTTITQFIKTNSTPDEGASAPVHNTPKESEQDARALLLSALKRKEFITHTKLSAWMGDLSLPADVLQNFHRAIDELDYEKAISLLE